MHIIANQEGAKAVYGSDNYKDQRDIAVYLENSEPVESAFIEKLDNTEGVKVHYIIKNVCFHLAD